MVTELDAVLIDDALEDKMGSDGRTIMGTELHQPKGQGTVPMQLLHVLRTMQGTVPLQFHHG